MERKGYTTITKDLYGLSLNEIWIYAVIKSYRKKEGYSDLTYKQISEYSGISEKTVEKIIPNLIKNKSLFSKVDKVDIGNNRKQNNYYFPNYDNYFFVDNKFIVADKNYKEKSILLIIKSLCLNNTNECKLSRNEISKLTKISLPTLRKYINNAVALDFIKDDLTITNKYILERKDKADSLDELNTYNYKVICKLCDINNVEAPKRDDKLLNYISSKCIITSKDDAKKCVGGFSMYLPYILKTRCPKLPNKVNLAYFVKVINNIDYKPAKPIKIVL